MKTRPGATGCPTESPVPEEAAAESAGAAPAVPRTPFGCPGGRRADLSRHSRDRLRGPAAYPRTCGTGRPERTASLARR
jgi:hypothetical protein